MNTSMSKGLKHWFDWYQSEKPCWEKANSNDPAAMTWNERIAVQGCSTFIINTLRQEALDRGELDPRTTTQQVFENHTVWLRNLVDGQRKLWKEASRS